MTTYYVSHQTGNDANDGLVYTKAFATLTKLCDVAVAGDMAYVGPGVYLDNGQPFVGDPPPSTLVGDPECSIFLNDSPGEVRIYEPDTIAVIGKLRIRTGANDTTECNIYNILDTDKALLKIKTNYGIGRLLLVSPKEDTSSGVILSTPKGIRAIGTEISESPIPVIDKPLDNYVYIGTSITIEGQTNSEN